LSDPKAVSDFERSVVFVDRDGVINEDRGYEYVKSWDEFVFIPGVKETFARLEEQGVPVIVVSNQSCVGKGLVTAGQVEEIHERMAEEIERAGGRVLGVYVCPHTDEDECVCRKPSPGMLIQAAGDFGVDLRRSFVVGDSVRDLEAGRQVGARTVLVLSGKGRQELDKARLQNVTPDFICERLEDLVEIIRQASPVSPETREK